MTEGIEKEEYLLRKQKKQNGRADKSIAPPTLFFTPEKIIKPYQRAANILLITSLVALTLGAIGLAAGLGSPAFAAIVVNELAKQIYFWTSIALLTVGTGMFVGSMANYHRVNTHNRNHNLVTKEMKNNKNYVPLKFER